MLLYLNIPIEKHPYSEEDKIVSGTFVQVTHVLDAFGGLPWHVFYLPRCIISL